MEGDQQAKREDIGSRLLNRMGSVFRRGSRRTRSTVTQADVEESRVADTTFAPVIAPAAAPSAPQPSQTGTAAPAEVVTAPEQDVKPVIQWSEVQQERARALFAKYGLSLEPEEWMSPRNLEVQRVEKPIRMRVRRTCHRCQTTFGSDRVCVNCQHVRCKDCPRYPLARTTEEKEARALAKAKGKQAEQPLESVVADFDNTKKRQKPAPITMASRTGGQDLVHKPIKQRVRRTCHQCQTLFKGTSTQCESCGHTRCKICPRDPPKLKKYPDGYPGDEDPPIERPSRTWKKPRMRVRYYCNKCDTLYKPGETNCNGCGEEKGPNTRRQPPKKEKPPIDPDLLKRVQERLEQLRVGESNDT